MRMRGFVATAVLATAVLAGCAPTPSDAGEQSPDPQTQDPAPDGTSAPTPEGAPVFRMPDACDDLVTAATAERFEAAGLVLLGGPGQPYFGDPTPEERVGGITCVWGDEADASTTIIVSVAPLTPSARPGVVSDLLAQGLNESVAEGAIAYAQIGDEVSAPGVLNVLRNESWISVIEALGGEERFQRATELVDEITTRVYVEA